MYIFTCTHQHTDDHVQIDRNDGGYRSKEKNDWNTKFRYNFPFFFSFFGLLAVFTSPFECRRVLCFFLFSFVYVFSIILSPRRFESIPLYHGIDESGVDVFVDRNAFTMRVYRFDSLYVFSSFAEGTDIITCSHLHWLLHTPDAICTTSSDIKWYKHTLRYRYTRSSEAARIEFERKPKQIPLLFLLLLLRLWLPPTHIMMLLNLDILI